MYVKIMQVSLHYWINFIFQCWINETSYFNVVKLCMVAYIAMKNTKYHILDLTFREGELTLL